MGYLDWLELISGIFSRNSEESQSQAVQTEAWSDGHCHWKGPTPKPLSALSTVGKDPVSLSLQRECSSAHNLMLGLLISKSEITQMCCSEALNLQQICRTGIGRSCALSECSVYSHRPSRLQPSLPPSFSIPSQQIFREDLSLSYSVTSNKSGAVRHCLHVGSALNGTSTSHLPPTTAEEGEKDCKSRGLGRNAAVTQCLLNMMHLAHVCSQGTPSPARELYEIKRVAILAWMVKHDSAGKTPLLDEELLTADGY